MRQQASSAVSAMPASGILESRPPKPIGSNNNGSNFAIASHSSSRLTSSMMARLRQGASGPMPRSRAFRLFHFSSPLPPASSGCRRRRPRPRLHRDTAYRPGLCGAGFRFPSSWLPESAAHRLRPPFGPRWQSPSRYCLRQRRGDRVPAPAGAAAGWRGGRNGCGQLAGISPPSLTSPQRLYLPLPRCRYRKRQAAFATGCAASARQWFKTPPCCGGFEEFEADLREQRHGEHVVNGGAPQAECPSPAPGA